MALPLSLAAIELIQGPAVAEFHDDLSLLQVQRTLSHPFTLPVIPAQDLVMLERPRGPEIQSRTHSAGCSCEAGMCACMVQCWHTRLASVLSIVALWYLSTTW